MTVDPATTVTAIQEFVALAIQRRTGSPSGEDKTRLEALEEVLREQIDGARPAPKRSLGAPAKVPEAPSRPAPTLNDLAQKLELSLADRGKVNSVPREQLPRSAYTPPRTMSLFEDYFGEIAPPPVGVMQAPRNVVQADSDLASPLPQEARVLFGLARPAERRPERAAPAADAAPAGTRPVPVARVEPVRAAAPRLEARGIPTIVHLIAGGTIRGHIEEWSPESGAIQLLDDQGGLPSEVEIDRVLAVFFGQVRGEPPTPAVGRRLVVKLVNDRQVSGLTDDYQEGGDSLTLVPEQRKGNVDRIWIPAWAVKEIQLG